MSYIRQLYQASTELPDGRIVEVRYVVDRLPHSFHAEPEEHFGAPLWLLEEQAADPEVLALLLGSAKMNETIAKALPMGAPFLPADRKGLYEYN